MINLIGLSLAMLFIALMWIVTLLNISSYKKGNALIKISGILNILSLFVLAISLIAFRGAIYWITAILLIIIWLSALLHGVAQGKVNWPHHLVRAVIIIILLIMMFIP